MIIRMRLCKWDDAFECKALPMPVRFSVNSAGFLEVFDSIDDLHREYPGEHNYQHCRVLPSGAGEGE